MRQKNPVCSHALNLLCMHTSYAYTYSVLEYWLYYVCIQACKRTAISRILPSPITQEQWHGVLRTALPFLMMFSGFIRNVLGAWIAKDDLKWWFARKAFLRAKLPIETSIVVVSGGDTMTEMLPGIQRIQHLNSKILVPFIHIYAALSWLRSCRIRDDDGCSWHQHIPRLSIGLSPNACLFRCSWIFKEFC